MSILKECKLKEMVYGGWKESPEILAKGIANGHEFVILNLGNHPCSYIKIPESSKLKNIGYDNIPLDCHGGLTFSGKLEHVGLDGYWIGWDYGHAGDFAGYRIGRGWEYGQEDKKWTTDELLNEIWDVTFELKKLRILINKITETELMYPE